MPLRSSTLQYFQLRWSSTRTFDFSPLPSASLQNFAPIRFGLIRCTESVRRGSPYCAHIGQPDSVSNVIEIKLYERQSCCQMP